MKLTADELNKLVNSILSAIEEENERTCGECFLNLAHLEVVVYNAIQDFKDLTDEDINENYN